MTGGPDRQAENNRLAPTDPGKYGQFHNQAGQKVAAQASQRPLDSFFGADVGAKLVTAQKGADVEGQGVARKDHENQGKDQPEPLRGLADRNQQNQ